MWRSRRPGGLIGTAALALVLCLASFPVSAQVVIRESVDLGESSATVEAPESFGGGFTVSFVAQRDGFLSVFYGSMQRAGSPYPAGQPTLEVYRDGVLAGTDDVLSHTWPAPNIVQRNCGGLYDEYNYNTTETIPARVMLYHPAISGPLLLAGLRPGALFPWNSFSSWLRSWSVPVSAALHVRFRTSLLFVDQITLRSLDRMRA